MKHLTKWASLALFLIAAACAGTTARTEVLLPAMQQAWPPIHDAIERELAVAPDAAGTAALAGADAALQSGDPIAVASVAWAVLDALHEADATRRVDLGQIGPGVAESLRERLRQFAAARLTFTRSN